MRVLLFVVLLSACATTRVRVPAPAHDVRAAVPGVVFGGEDPDEQGGTWVAPEVVSLVRSLPLRPDRVVALVAPIAANCDELYRFRLVFGRQDRFANVSAFASESQARACSRSIQRSDPTSPQEAWHLAGRYHVQVTRAVAGDQGLRSAIFAAVDRIRTQAPTPVPQGQVPAGAPVGWHCHRRPPPPMS